MDTKKNSPNLSEGASKSTRQRKLKSKISRNKKDVQPMVHQCGKQGIAQSENVAAVFGKRPYDVFCMIGKKIDRLMNLGRNPERYFSLRNYIGKDGKEHYSYEMTRKGFDYLVLSFTGEKADKYKLAYIDLFHAYEQAALKEQANLLNDEWQATRSIGKQTHHEYTDQCRLFLEYAAEQRGNDGYAKHFYTNLAAAKLKALFAFSLQVKPARNLLSLKQLRRLENIDHVADVTLAAGMDAGLKHKDIYKAAVKALKAAARLSGGVEPVALS
jgi:Rha family phage regulatory protein